jgi:hypothetical protein
LKLDDRFAGFDWNKSKADQLSDRAGGASPRAIVLPLPPLTQLPIDSGTSLSTNLWKRSLEGLLTAYPKLFKVKRTALINATRARTRLSRNVSWSIFPDRQRLATQPLGLGVDMSNPLAIEQDALTA